MGGGFKKTKQKRAAFVGVFTAQFLQRVVCVLFAFSTKVIAF